MHTKFLSFSLLFLLKISSCECDYKWDYWFVEYDKNKGEFKRAGNIEGGTIYQSFNVEECKKTKDSLFIKASVYSLYELGNIEKDELFYIIGVKKDKTLDTLYTFSGTEIKDYKFSLLKYNSFVFKERESKIGKIYFTKGFNKYFKWD